MRISIPLTPIRKSQARAISKLIVLPIGGFDIADLEAGAKAFAAAAGENGDANIFRLVNLLDQRL